MVALAKKAVSEQLLTLALLLSLIRGPWEPMGGGPLLVRRSTLKNMLLDHRPQHYHALLSELATLASPHARLNHRPEWVGRGGGNFAAYLLTTTTEAAAAGAARQEQPVVQQPPALPSPPPEEPHEVAATSPPPPQHHDLSVEDMNLIEVLWKQDVDIGVPPLSLEDPPSEAINASIPTDKPLKEPPPSTKTASGADQPLLVKVSLEEEEEEEEEGPLTSIDPWAGLPYTIDLETGEYELCKGEEESLGLDAEVSSVLPAFDSFSLEEALKIAGLDQPKAELEEEEEEEEKEPGEEATMSHAAAHALYAPKPPHHLDGRMGPVRAGGMESAPSHQPQRWSELSHFLAPTQDEHFLAPPPAPPQYLADPRSVLLHNASLAPPLSDFNSSAAAAAVFSPHTGNQSFGARGASHLGSAVAASMNLTGASSEPLPPPESSYKMDHDAIYYQNSSNNGTEAMNGTAGEGFFSSILNDEELQLVDMAMNEGMYTMRLLDNSTAAPPPAANDADGSSDSAVSSMGSERAWGTEPSTSHSYLDYCSGSNNSLKYRPYDYSSAGGAAGGGAYGGSVGRGAGAGAAQKKHHMFAKRYFNEQHHPGAPGGGAHEGAVSPASKLEAARFSSTCLGEFRPHLDPHPPPPLLPPEAADHVTHNHTYQLPGLPEGAGTVHRRQSRDKNKTMTEEEHLSRDEKRARAMDVPITVDDIINLPMDEFNERLSKYDLTEAQLSLIRDIRRRGKNKVAAQNCRKRKLDQILSLADEVKLMRMRKNRLLRDKDMMQSERQQLKEKFSQLYRHVFQSLRDSEGRAYSPYEYSLQQAADGSVLLVPRKDEPKPSHPRPPPPPHHAPP